MSRGIGRGIAEELGRHGAAVAVDYRSSGEAAHDVVDAIEAEGGSAIAVRGDVADMDSVRGMCRRVRFSPARLDPPDRTGALGERSMDW